MSLFHRFFGAILAIGLTGALVQVQEKKIELNASRWPAITPQYSRYARQYGIALTWRF